MKLVYATNNVKGFYAVIRSKIMYGKLRLL